MTELLNLDELEAIAKRATPGPWDAEGDDSEGTVEVNAGTARTEWTESGTGFPARSWATTDRILERDDLWDDEWERAAADADHIAAFDPVTALALIAELRAFRAGAHPKDSES